MGRKEEAVPGGGSEQINWRSGFQPRLHVIITDSPTPHQLEHSLGMTQISAFLKTS